MIAEIVQNKAELVALCQQYRVKRLDLSGSAATGLLYRVSSDLDFIASFADADQPGYARRYFEFAESLERLFGRSVDLLTERSVNNLFFRESVNHSRVTIYEDRSEEVVA